MEFIKNVKTHYKKIKNKTVKIARTTIDTVQVAKESIRTIREMKKIYDDIKEKPNEGNHENRKTKNNVDDMNTNNGPIIDVDFEETK